MEAKVERNWTAHLVISSEHAGLRPYFKQLEAEMYSVLARVDNPKHVLAYVTRLLEESRAWRYDYEGKFPKK